MLFAAGAVAAQTTPTPDVPASPERVVADSAAVAAARRAFAKARLGPGGPDGAAGINARWALARALEDEQRWGEAEAEYRVLEALFAAQVAPEDRNLIAIRQRIAAVQVGREDFAGALETALPTYANALTVYGADHEVTQDLRMAVAASLARLGRYAESEPYARAGFDHMRAHGDAQGAADIAATLALIYRRLERPDEARAVLLLVEGDDPLRRLINEAERAEEPVGEAAAWRRVVEALPADSADRTDYELKLAFALSMTRDPAATGEAATLARALAARGRAGGDVELVAQAEQILADALTAEVGENVAASDTALGVARRQVEQALAGGDPEATAVVKARVYLAMTAAAQKRFDIAVAELDLIDGWIAGHPGGLDAQTVAYTALTRAFVLGERQDLAGAYHALERTSRATQAVALSRTDGSGRSHLNHWSGLFRTQVRWAWRYAGRLDAPGSGTPVD